MRLSLLLIFLSMGLSACGGFAPEPLYGREAPPAAEKTPQPEDKPQVVDPARERFDKINALILKDQCLRCHNPQNMKGQVDLSTWDAIARRSDLFKAGDADNSSIYITVLEGSMPPRNMLSDELTEVLRLWIQGEELPL